MNSLYLVLPLTQSENYLEDPKKAKLKEYERRIDQLGYILLSFWAGHDGFVEILLAGGFYLVIS